MGNKATRGFEPTDRLTRICDAMTFTFNRHPEYREGDRCMVFLDDGDRGGIVLEGYDDDSEAMAYLLMHLTALFNAVGKRLDVMFMDPDVTRRGGSVPDDR